MAQWTGRWLGGLEWRHRSHPLDVGFGRSYIMAATNDRVPVYIDQNRVDGLDPDDKLEACYDESAPDMENELLQGKDHHDQLRVMYSHGHDGAIVNGVSRIGRQAGGTNTLWTDETMGEVFSEKAKEFTSEAANNIRPSSCTTPSHQPHVPRLPSPRFKGSTEHGDRGDVIAEMDWCARHLLSTSKP